MKFPNKPKYNIKPGVRLRNKFNNEIVIGDIINEEEIEGKYYYVLRNEKGNVVKLTKEAYTLTK